MTLSCAVLLASAAVAFTNSLVTLEFDGKGRVVSLRERASGRELVDRPVPFVGAAFGRECGFLGAENLACRDGDLVFGFAHGLGSVTVRPQPFDGGWSFEVTGFALPKATRLFAACLRPACRQAYGRRAGMLSDGASGVCVRGYAWRAETDLADGGVRVVTDPGSAPGLRFGLVAAPRASLAAALQAMTVASGRPHSAAGGAWATTGEAARTSYLNGDVTAASVDDWLDLMERGGFGVLHFREKWYACRGHYPVNTNDWPNGLADMKAAVGKVHAAGYYAGMHTLSGCIDPKDPWVAGPENAQLAAWESYTLAEPLAADATEMTVAEPPVVRHDTILTYSGNGNAIRVDGEIVQYSGFTDRPPYRYTGLTRGAFGTRAAAHAKGAKADYLRQRYIAFYPRPDAPLADKVAAAIGDVFNGCGFDQIYCDGLEGMGDGYAMAAIRDKIMAQCTASGRPVLNEDSCTGPQQAWWYHSRVGAWDSCFWAPKRFHDFHVAAMKRENVRFSDFLEVQMGWWSPLLSCPHFPAHKIDDMEYYASRNAGLDASMSIANVNVSRHPLRFHRARAITVLGWYERARRARVFREDVRRAFDAERAEFRLRQDASDGVWKVAPVTCVTRKSCSPETSSGTFGLPAAPAKSAVRVEALYAGQDGDPIDLTGAFGADALKRACASKDVSLEVAETTGAPDGRRAFALTATNAGASSRGAWARASAEIRPYRVVGNHWVLRFAVKGDGSGALLNVQLETPREFGRALSEHYVTLDFTGWRTFEMPMRERDAARYADYVWPYTGYASVFHSILNMNNISGVNFYLNEIPSGGRASVEVTDVALHVQRQVRIERHAVRANGRTVEVPFAMWSGWFAELEDGVWTLYSADGDPLERKVTGEALPLKAGENAFAYGSKTADGSRARAELTFFACGEPEPAHIAPSAWPASARKLMSYEAADPQVYAPSKGFAELAPVVTRPDGTAAVEAWVYGPVRPCTVRLGTEEKAVPEIGKDRRALIRFDGRVTGSTPVSVRSDDPEAFVRIEFIKRY